MRERSVKNTPEAIAKALEGDYRQEHLFALKQAVEELIYNTQTLRDRLIMELQARCGLRIGETLKIEVSDAVDRRLILKEPKSGKEWKWPSCRNRLLNDSMTISNRRISRLGTVFSRFATPRPGP